MTEVAVEAEGRLLAWIPGWLRNPLNGAHGHWSVRARERKGWRERAHVCVRNAMIEGKWRLDRRAPKVVVLTAYVWNLYDEDGLAASMKPLIDGLVDAGVLHEDGPRSGHRFERRQVVNRKHRGVEVVVEPRAPAEGARA